MGGTENRPCPVIAASTPADCFHAAFEAARIAMRYMTPVILLTDGVPGQRLGALAPAECR